MRYCWALLSSLPSAGFSSFDSQGFPRGVSLKGFFSIFSNSNYNLAHRLWCAQFTPHSPPRMPICQSESIISSSVSCASGVQRSRRLLQTRLVVYVGVLSSLHVCTRAMVKSKGTKRGRKKKRVAAHIKDAAEKRAASAFSGNSGEDQKTQLLASPLGVGRPKRPREPGQFCSVSYTAAGHLAISM